MKNTIVTVAALAAVALGIFSASGQAPAKPTGVLSVLRPGQPVTLKDANGRFEISIFDSGPDLLGYKVVDVGSEYVVVQDVSSINEIRIPIWSIKSIVTLKVPK